MTTQPQQWLGIDISKTRLDVAVHPMGVSFQVEHSPARRAELIEKLSAYSMAGIVL